MSGGVRQGTPASPDTRQASVDLGVPVVLYDGWCNLCNSSVGFILRRDRQAVFRFAALQSAAAAERLRPCKAKDLRGETLVLVYRGRCQTRSDALLTILARLPQPWPILAVVRFLPRRLRDGAYDFVARHRARWFGGPEVCMTSLAKFHDRFLE